MAKQDKTKAMSLTAKFQATAVNDDPERVYLKTMDAPDASGNNDNTIQGGAELLITNPEASGFFQAGGEYTVVITPVAK